jgi:hypothetical protein
MVMLIILISPSRPCATHSLARAAAQKAADKTLTDEIAELAAEIDSIAKGYDAAKTALATLKEPLVITVHLTPEDPRYLDLRRNVLSTLQRAMPNVTINLVGGRQMFGSVPTDNAYGEVEFTYGSRSDTTRSTSPSEILALLYALAGREPPAPIAGAEYAGYPLVANAQGALAWFFGGLPLLILIAWWWSRRPPRISRIPVLKEVQT